MCNLELHRPFSVKGKKIKCYLTKMKHLHITICYESDLYASENL